MALRILPIVIDHWIRPTNTYYQDKFMKRLQNIYTRRILLNRFRAKNDIAILNHMRQLFVHEDDVDVAQEEKDLLHDIRNISQQMVDCQCVFSVCHMCNSHVIIANTYVLNENNNVSITEFTCQSKECGHGYVLTIQPDAYDDDDESDDESDDETDDESDDEMYMHAPNDVIEM
jgi:hypothetical protein